MLTNDPAMGVIRHTDAGYDQAATVATERGVRVPMAQLMSFADLWRELEPLGRDPGTGGYRRYSWTEADAQCRAWFTRQAEKPASPWSQTTTATCGPGGTRPRNPRSAARKTPSSPAATWIRSPTAGATTERSASRPRWPPSKC